MPPTAVRGSTGGERAAIPTLDLTSWGWIHLVRRSSGDHAGIGLFKVTLWARILGVTVAALLIIANSLSIPYPPLWSIGRHRPLRRRHLGPVRRPA